MSTRSHCSHTRMPAESQYEVVPLHENPEHDGGAERPGSRQGRATRQALAFRAVSIALAATAMVVLCFGVVSREGHHQTEMIATSPSSSASAAGHRQQLARGRAESKRFLKEMGYPSDYLEADVQLARGRAESKRFLKEMGYPVGVPSANTTSPNTSSLRLHEKRNTTMLYRATRGASDPRTGKLSWFAQKSARARVARAHVEADRSDALTLARWSLMPLSRAGILLLQCSDSVSWGKWGDTDMTLITRFHHEYGTRYTVECPTRCLSALPLIYGLGKGPYMDETSICKAAGNHKSFVLFIIMRIVTCM